LISKEEQKTQPRERNAPLELLNKDYLMPHC
jgi:hypothetical protein